ncbi:MAG TPA: glycerol-3-phosphate 1-O-acyltransferase PlsY [Nitrospirota bacterium]
MEWSFVVLAYLIGCIPFGVIIAKVRGVDLRSQGSGNIGATNALRVMGKKAGAVTLVGDILKGTAAVLIAARFGGRDIGIYAAAAAVLGHDFPVTARFKGGKGVAASYGVLLGLAPAVALTGFATWLAAALITRVSSLGALISFALTPAVCYILFRGDSALLVLSVFLTVLIFLKHKGNIQRLMHGAEPKIGRKADSRPE